MIKILSVALLSQAIKSECGTAQPSPCIAGDNVLKIIMPEPLPEARALTNEAPRKLDTEWKTEKKKKKLSTCRSRAYYVSAGQKIEQGSEKASK